MSELAFGLGLCAYLLLFALLLRGTSQGVKSLAVIVGEEEMGIYEVQVTMKLRVSADSQGAARLVTERKLDIVKEGRDADLGRWLIKSQGQEINYVLLREESGFVKAPGR